MGDKVSMGLGVCAAIALAVFVFTALFLAAADAFAERNGRGWGGGGEYNRRYDVSTVCRISGQVVRVERFAPRHGMSRGVHLVVRVGGGDLLVALGPAWFVDVQDESLKTGDRVEVVGSRIEYRGEAVLVAADVTKGDRSLTLREPNGRPVWVGSRQGPRTGASAGGHRDGASVGNRESSVAATPLYQTDLDRHLWLWEDRHAGGDGRREAAGRTAA